MPACISLDNVTKSYGATVAVSRLTLDVRRGEIFGLLGPNGAGKSTTLLMLCGLVRPISGTIQIFGQDFREHFLDIIPRMGVLLERPAFYDRLTVAKNLSLLTRLARKNITIDRALDLVDMTHLAEERVANLSSGFRQRLGLAQAFLTEPELLLLDEPTNGLDVEHAYETLRLLRRLASEAGVTIVFSSHLMHEVENLCDRVAILNRGQLIACEKTESLLSHDNTTVDVLLDSPEAASRQLAEQEWVRAVELQHGKLIVRLIDPKPHRLNTFLVEAGYHVHALTPRRQTLQEYFLKALNS